MHTEAGDIAVPAPDGALSDEQLAAATGGDAMQDLQNIMRAITQLLNTLQAMNTERIRNL